MRTTTSFLILTLVLATGVPVRITAQDAETGPQRREAAQTQSSESLSPDEILGPIREELLAQFDDYLKSPEDYRKRVTRECAVFPEGDLFPYVYPAMAYVNVALEDPTRQEHCARQARKLIDLAIASVTDRVHPPERRLDQLTDYRNHATHLGQLNLALGALGLISDDHRYDAIHRRVSDVLYEGLVQSRGRPLQSYPQRTWPFDTIPVLVSLQRYDAGTGGTRSQKLIREHLAWVRANATHPDLGLPYSKVDDATGKAQELPRGCDISLRLCLLPHIDALYAREMYAQYVKHHWLDRGMLAGFAEWPNGMKRFEDIDSGPIVMGIGLGATGLGLGTTIALDDGERLRRLCGELRRLEALRRLFSAAQPGAAGIRGSRLLPFQLDDQHVTGFLFGDAMLFYCITWQSWNVRAQAAHGESRSTAEEIGVLVYRALEATIVLCAAFVFYRMARNKQDRYARMRRTLSRALPFLKSDGYYYALSFFLAAFAVARAVEALVNAI